MGDDGDGVVVVVLLVLHDAVFPLFRYAAFAKSKYSIHWV